MLVFVKNCTFVHITDKIFPVTGPCPLNWIARLPLPLIHTPHPHNFLV